MENNLIAKLNLEILYKINNEIITNIDIENEKKYLFFLNPKLKSLDQSRSDNIAKNSLINDLIKKKELKRIFNFDKEDKFVDIIEKNLIKRKKIDSQENFKNILSKNNINYQNVREKFKIESLWNRLIYNKSAYFYFTLVYSLLNTLNKLFLT